MLHSSNFLGVLEQKCKCGLCVFMALMFTLCDECNESRLECRNS